MAKTAFFKAILKFCTTNKIFAYLFHNIASQHDGACFLSTSLAKNLFPHMNTLVHIIYQISLRHLRLLQSMLADTCFTLRLPYLPLYKSTRCISRPSKIREKLPILSYILCISRP